MNRADYEIVRVEEDRIFIADLDLGNRSVTNDAENVYQEIQNHFPGKRLIYRDSEKNWDEISILNNDCVDAGLISHYLWFKPYNEHIPESSEIKNFPSSELLRK